MAKSASAAGQAFSRKEPCNAGNVSSTGLSLWSYGWWEMACWIRDSRDGTEYIMVRNGPRYSVSTACQFSRSGLWRYGLTSPVETPVRQDLMNLPEWATRLDGRPSSTIDAGSLVQGRYLDPHDPRRPASHY